MEVPYHRCILRAKLHAVPMGRASGKCLVGIDGGASTVRAWRLRQTGDGVLLVADKPVRHVIPRQPGFRPIPLARQLAERERGVPHLPEREIAQAACVLEHTLEAVLEAAGPAPNPLVLGVCMPGLQDDAGRGVLALRHGARLPGFLDALVAALEVRGLDLRPAPRRLVSDGRAAGWGEVHGAEGALRGVGTALVVAGGTGIAEALLLDGAFPPLADQRRWLEPAWQLASPAGPPYEDVLSMAAINAAWKRHAPGDERFVEDAAAHGCVGARRILGDAARQFACFLHARLTALHGMGLVAPPRGVERLVLGQRTADLFADPRLGSCFADALRNRLASRLVDADDASMREAYLDGKELRADLLVASRLHAAPGIGAVAATLGLVTKES